MYSFEIIIGERNLVLSPLINEKISKTPVFIDWKRPILCSSTAFSISTYEPRREKIVFFFCICKNKDADQLRGNREADQRLCFRYIDSTIPLLPKYEIAILRGCTAWFVWDLVANPEDRFSHNEARFLFGITGSDDEEKRY